VAYNDYSSRGVHERKKHGAIFTAAVHNLALIEAADEAAAAATQAAAVTINSTCPPEDATQDLSRGVSTTEDASSDPLMTLAPHEPL